MVNVDIMVELKPPASVHLTSTLYSIFPASKFIADSLRTYNVNSVSCRPKASSLLPLTISQVCVSSSSISLTFKTANTFVSPLAFFCFIASEISGTFNVATEGTSLTSRTVMFAEMSTLMLAVACCVHNPLSHTADNNLFDGNVQLAGTSSVPASSVTRTHVPD